MRIQYSNTMRIQYSKRGNDMSEPMTVHTEIVSSARRRSRWARPATVSAALVAALGVLSLATGFGSVQPVDAQTAVPQRGAPDFAGMLIQGLKETEGCLGVDAANFQSGKNTIVAWFENKDVAVRWYNAPAHQRMMGAVGGGGGTPLEHVTDPDTPIMVMASISFDGPPAIEGGPLPFSQISIEMYAPLPGGASINGRLAPESFKVPHHKVIGG
jgi:hypothetical protein